MTAERLVEQIKQSSHMPGPSVHYAPEFAAAVAAIVNEAREGDLILTLGAGNVSQLAPQILAALETTKKDSAQ